MQTKQRMSYSEVVKAVRASDHTDNKEPTAKQESTHKDNRQTADQAVDHAISLRDLLSQLMTLIITLISKLMDSSSSAVNTTKGTITPSPT